MTHTPTLFLTLFLSIWIGSMTSPTDASNALTPEVDVDEENVTTGEIRRGVVVGSTDGKSREQRIYERAIAVVEPSLIGNPARLDAYIDLFKLKFVGDNRLFFFDAKATWDPQTATLTINGQAEYEEHHESIEKYFRYMGFEKIDNQVELLPAASLGEQRFAILNTHQAFIYSAPTEPRETITQTVLGDPLYLLSPADNNHYLVHGPDGYTGYIAADNLVRVDAERFNGWRSRDQAVLHTSIKVNDIPLSLGISLPIVAQSADHVRVELPDGSQTLLPFDAIDIHPNLPDPRSEATITVAHQLLGVPYVWGGIAADGLDCSGFVQITHRSQGVLLPRDADMQGTMGSLSGTRWHRDNIRRGDLMLFLGSRGRINHVGIYLGDGQYIESAGGGVQITSIDPKDDNYNERRDKAFCFAKRLFR
ncbi:MAG: C40 family peptidase [Phycisphaeraceae bacterium]